MRRRSMSFRVPGARTMARRTARWRLMPLVPIVGAFILGCGGQAFSVASGVDSGAASGSSSGAASAGTQSGSSGSQSGANSASGASAAGSASGAPSSGSHSGSIGSTSSGSSTGGSSGGGESGSSGSGESGSSGSPSDGGTAISCPVIAPNAGAICPKANLQCEYGTNPDLRCNQLAVCQASSWSYASASNCPVAMCPTTYDDIQAGGHCPLPQETCAYPKGTCICSENTGGPARLVDASIATNWTCFDATLACRSPRPDIGQPCADDARKCDYGSCTGGIELVCTDGLWQEDFPPCAQAN